MNTIFPKPDQRHTLADLVDLRALEAQNAHPQTIASVRNRIVERYLPLVHRLARKRAYPLGLDINDLYQDGVLGLYRAIDLYDETVGVLFLTFAWRVVDQEINKATIRYRNPLSIKLRSRNQPPAPRPVELEEWHGVDEKVDPVDLVDAHRIVELAHAMEDRAVNIMINKVCDETTFREIAEGENVSKQRMEQLSRLGPGRIRERLERKAYARVANY